MIEGVWVWEAGLSARREFIAEEDFKQGKITSCDCQSIVIVLPDERRVIVTVDGEDFFFELME